ncbi:MAG: NAD(P)H-dependent oxidoreductase [bacterium]
MRILAVCGSLNPNSRTHRLRLIAIEAITQAGATVDYLDLREEPLPLYIPHGSQGEHEKRIADIQSRIERADAFLFGSPEYHGSMSGAMKNFLDFHYEELAGKLAGLLCSTGGSMGTSCLNHMRQSCLDCHAWTLPYDGSARGADWDKQSNTLTNPQVRDRLEKLGRDVVVYGKLLRGQFMKDTQTPAEVNAGFAGWHRD